jgi:hypothetical protein
MIPASEYCIGLSLHSHIYLNKKESGISLRVRVLLILTIINVCLTFQAPSYFQVASTRAQDTRPTRSHRDAHAGLAKSWRAGGAMGRSSYSMPWGRSVIRWEETGLRVRISEVYLFVLVVRHTLLAC